MGGKSGRDKELNRMENGRRVKVRGAGPSLC